MISARALRPGPAFTLVELLVSMAVLAMVILMIAALSNSTAQIWSSGERTIENNQTGRAVLEIVARELSQAVVSPRLPLVQDPTLPTDANARDASSLFWIAPLSSTSNGDLCEVGYYLTKTFELKRFFVPPSDANNYQIFATTPTDCSPRPTGSTGSQANYNDHGSAALWVTNCLTKKDGSGRAVSTTLATGVLHFFVRCLDANGDPIPWLSTGLKYNSAEPMQPATPGTRNTAATNPSSFTYTYYNAGNPNDTQNTAPAHLLPYAIELTLITTDLKSLQRLGSAAVPAPPTVTGTYAQPAGYAPNFLPAAPMAVPGNIARFIQSAQAAGFREVRSFSTTVRLRNAAQ